MQFNAVTLTVLFMNLSVPRGCADLVLNHASSVLIPRYRVIANAGITARIETLFTTVPDVVATRKQLSHATDNPRIGAIPSFLNLLRFYHKLLIAFGWSMLALLLGFVGVAACHERPQQRAPSALRFGVQPK